MGLTRVEGEMAWEDGVGEAVRQDGDVRCLCLWEGGDGRIRVEWTEEGGLELRGPCERWMDPLVGLGWVVLTSSVEQHAAETFDGGAQRSTNQWQVRRHCLVRLAGPIKSNFPSRVALGMARCTILRRASSHQ